MKIWTEYGSEHSTNLVMIGRFQQAKDAEQVKKILDQLTQQAMDEADIPGHDAKLRNQKYSESMSELLTALKIYTVGPTELEQLLYDATLKVDDNSIIITTDEIDVSVFIKILITKGARIEMYSAHDYPDTDKEQGETN